MIVTMCVVDQVFPGIFVIPNRKVVLAQSRKSAFASVVFVTSFLFSSSFAMCTVQ